MATLDEANRFEADSSRSLSDDLVIAVYLDTNVLLDLLATVEDGFRLVERVTTGETSGSGSERSGQAAFGTPSFFNLFKVGFSGKLEKGSSEARSETRESELTHTYGSLLHRLRRYLHEEGLVTNPSNAPTFAVGRFVEFSGVVRPNPFTDSFHKLQRMLGVAEMAMILSETTSPSQPSNPGNKNQSQRRSSPGRQTSQLKSMETFFERLTADVEREGTNTILVDSGQGGYKAVITLFDDFLRDRSMAEILNREFRILGKIARHLPIGSTERVDLIASSGVSGFSPEILQKLSGAIEEMSSSGGAQLESPTTTIEAPVIEIVPIAIYL
jgi:hypothetical protein